jgi:hypothetical protein
LNFSRSLIRRFLARLLRPISQVGPVALALEKRLLDVMFRTGGDPFLDRLGIAPARRDRCRVQSSLRLPTDRPSRRAFMGAE